MTASRPRCSTARGLSSSSTGRSGAARAGRWRPCLTRSPPITPAWSTWSRSTSTRIPARPGSTASCTCPTVSVFAGGEVSSRSSVPGRSPRSLREFARRARAVGRLRYPSGFVRRANCPASTGTVVRVRPRIMDVELLRLQAYQLHIHEVIGWLGCGRAARGAGRQRCGTGIPNTYRARHPGREVTIGRGGQFGQPALGVGALGHDVADTARQSPEAAGSVMPAGLRACWLVHVSSMRAGGCIRQWQ